MLLRSTNGLVYKTTSSSEVRKADKASFLPVQPLANRSTSSLSVIICPEIQLFNLAPVVNGNTARGKVSKTKKAAIQAKHEAIQDAFAAAANAGFIASNNARTRQNRAAFYRAKHGK